MASSSGILTTCLVFLLISISLISSCFVYAGQDGSCPYVEKQKQQQQQQHTAVSTEEEGCPYLAKLKREAEQISGEETIAVHVDPNNGQQPPVSLKKLDSMPGPKPNLVEKLFFGGHNDPDFIRFTSVQPYLDYANEFGDLVHYVLGRGGDFVLVSSAEELQTVYDSRDYYRRPDAPYFGYTYARVVGKKDQSLFDAIANGWGESWFKLRHVVDSILRDRVPTQLADFNTHARELVKYIRTNGLNNTDYSPYQDLSKAQVRLQGRQTYGSFFTEEIALEYDAAVAAWVNYMPKFLPFSYTPGKGWPLVAGIFRLTLENHLDNVSVFQRKVLAHKRATGDYGNDWMGLLATTPGPDGHLLSDEEILIVCFDVFILGSSGPGPIFLEYGFYLFGTNKDEQSRFRESLKDWKSSDVDLTMDDLLNHKALHNTFREIMRSYPPGGGINGRQTTENTILGSYLLPKGTQVIVNAYRIHNDSRYWTNPQKFDPDRFNQERNEPRHPYAFTPFGGGKRRCPGYQHATLDLMITMAHLYKTFEVTYTDPSPPKMIFQVTARPKKHFPVIFKEVKH